jgi:hypothetical protein
MAGGSVTLHKMAKKLDRLTMKEGSFAALVIVCKIAAF